MTYLVSFELDAKLTSAAPANAAKCSLFDLYNSIMGFTSYLNAFLMISVIELVLFTSSWLFIIYLQRDYFNETEVDEFINCIKKEGNNWGCSLDNNSFYI